MMTQATIAKSRRSSNSLNAELSGGRSSRGRTYVRNRIPEIEESLIVDGRAHLTPSQLVENKLMSLLKRVFLPVSHARTKGLRSARTHC
jgi:hypothetical protein